MTPTTGPQTEAGRALIGAPEWDRVPLHMAESRLLLRAILAIEQEAAATAQAEARAEVEQLRNAVEMVWGLWPVEWRTEALSEYVTAALATPPDTDPDLAGHVRAYGPGFPLGWQASDPEPRERLEDLAAFVHDRSGVLEYIEDARTLVWTDRIGPNEYGVSQVVASYVLPWLGRIIGRLAAARPDPARDGEGGL